MDKNKRNKAPRKFTKQDLWELLTFVLILNYYFWKGYGCLDWLYNLCPKMEAWVVDCIVAVVYWLISCAVSAIYSTIQKKKQKPSP